LTKSKLDEAYAYLLSYYGEHQKIPIDSFQELLGKGATRQQAIDLLADLAEEDPLPFTPKEPSKSTPPQKEKPLLLKPLIKKRTRTKKNVDMAEGSYSVPFLKFFALPFSVTALFLSAYFSVDFLAKQFHWALAIALSVTIIGFGTVCFECLTLFTKRKSWGWAILFGVMWLGITVYSVGTSISALYESYLLRVYNRQVTMEDTNANRRLYDSYKEEEKEKAVLMEDKRARLSIQQSVLTEFATTEKQAANRKAYDTAYWQAYQLEKEITALSNRISELRAKEQELLKLDTGIARDASVEDRPDIYRWLAKIFKTNEDYMQFLLQVIPASALDAISPLGLYLFLFLRKKEER
jgi:hypothetical protein